MARPFVPAASSSPAAWVARQLTDFAVNVWSLVPSGFEAYARVFHPAEKVTYTSPALAEWLIEPICWTEVAALTGRTAHPAMQWASLNSESSFIDDESALKVGDVWVRGPDIGNLPTELAQALRFALEPHTTTRDSCFFAIWEGFGCLPHTVLDVPAFELPAREYRLFTGPLEAIKKTFCTDTDNIESALSGGYMALIDPDVGELGVEEPAQAMSRDVLVSISSDEPTPEAMEAALEHLLASQKPMYQSANLWWPHDHAWFVHTEIDLNTTYVGGSQRLVDAMLQSEALEAYQIDPTDEITYNGDTLNPLPSDPYGNNFKLP